ncbi:MAG TPA: hypothetical protein VLF89_03905 [Candidatus Saccharimonadales bacterium]|nr:hypothetical protein [Candidatus Saccharimonadales bacterium]
MEKSQDEIIVKLRKQGIGMISALTLEYILGMITTFFIQFPENRYEGAAWKFAWTQIPVVLHIIIGLFIFLGSLVLLIRAMMSKSKTWVVASGSAFLAIIAAVLGGVVFITKQTEIYSFTMAISFIIAFLAYFYGVYASKSSV